MLMKIFDQDVYVFDSATTLVKPEMFRQETQQETRSQDSFHFQLVQKQPKM